MPRPLDPFFSSSNDGRILRPANQPFVNGPVPVSLPRGRLPQLDLVSLRVHHPAEFSILRVVDLLENVAAFFPECLQEAGQVSDAIVHHEGGRAGRELLAAEPEEGPCRGARTAVVCPGERRTAPVLDVDAQVLLVPGSQGNRVLRLKEDAADACHSPHSSPRPSVGANATFSVRTAAPRPPSRTPAGSRAAGRGAARAPRTTSARGPRPGGAPRTRPHRSIPLRPTPAGASRRP